jgi:hypothetical protein
MQVGATYTYNNDADAKARYDAIVARNNAAKSPSLTDTLINAGTTLINAHANAQVTKINAKSASKYGAPVPDYTPAQYSDSFSGQDLLGKNGGLILGAIGVLGVVLVAMKMTAKTGKK